MEEELDEVEEGRTGWTNVLHEFYEGFKQSLERAHIDMRDIKREEIPTDIPCEKCGKMLVVKWGRNGSFLACSGYPECRNTKEYTKSADGKIEVVPEQTTDEKCPDCQSAMAVRRGRFGKFLACTRYPECKGTRPITTGIACPENCGGQLVEKRSKRGKIFYSCSSYPNCKFALWDKPVAKPCPMCAAPFLLERNTRRDGHQLKCWRAECGYVATVGEAPVDAAGAAGEAPGDAPAEA
jgi:DNA topoisomerase-1